MEIENGDRQFSSGSWLVLGAVGLLALLITASTLAILSLPGDGWQMVYEEPPLTSFVGDWRTSLQEGDVVLAADGVPINSETVQPLDPPQNWQAGATVPYTILRDGRQQTVEVLLGKLTRRGILLALANTMRQDLPQMSWFIVGLFVFLLRPGSPPARLLFLAGAALALVTRIGWAATTISGYFAPPLLFFVDRMTGFFWGWLFFPSIILFMLYFAPPIWPMRRHPRLVPALLFLIPVGIGIMTFATGRLVPANILLAAEAILIVATAVVVVISAYRSGADPTTRAQVSWVALGVAISIGGTLIAYLLTYVGRLVLPPLVDSFLSWPVAFALPVCVAIAILRFRLFDIDVIIRKTLIYTVLTGLLALVYLGLVVVLQSLVEALGGQQSPLTIVISTLVIVALFSPLRRRVQDVIDRRFFRTKYNAQQVLAHYVQSVRDETDIDVLTAELQRAVTEAMQPSLVTVWLQESRSTGPK